MKLKNLIFILVILLVFGGIFVVPAYLEYFRQSQRTIDDLVLNMKDLVSEEKVDSFDLIELGINDKSSSLVQPETMYPSPTIDPGFLFYYQKQCSLTRSKINLIQDWKTKSWIRFICDKKPLPSNIVSAVPFNHPTGGSWAYFLYKNVNEFKNTEWLQAHKSLLHVLEMPELFPQESIWLKWLNFGTYYMVLNKAPSFLINDHAIFVDPQQSWAYKVYNRSTWDRLSERIFIQLSNWNPEHCDFTEGYVCWNWNYSKILFEKIKAALWLLIVILLVGMIIFRLSSDQKAIQLQAERDRQLLVQTLAHELRHPVTGLKFSIEAFRDQYESLNDNLKNEFLRMASQLQRLQRLIYASQQYLHSEDKEAPFKFNIAKVDSINNFVSDILENYTEKIKLRLLTSDTSITTDLYWLGMAITNLVKNALIHGKKPVYVELESREFEILIHIKDSGEGLRGNIDRYLSGEPTLSTAKGMGLGLSLVVRIIRLMGNKIEYSSNPIPTFTIRIKRNE